MSNQYPTIDGETERDYTQAHPEQNLAADDDSDDTQAALDRLATEEIISSGVRPVDFHVPERVICFDTETTGFDYRYGDRLISIGVVEVVGSEITREFEWMINPERHIPNEATRVHGITNRDVMNKPRFRDIAQDFLDFIGDAPLVAHNASFDMGFVQYQLNEVGYDPISNRVIDTLALARLALEPGKSASLDSLLKNNLKIKYQREKHGALVDAKLLAMVYTWFRKMALDLQASRPVMSPDRLREPRPDRDLCVVEPDHIAAHNASLGG